ncbi:hypothetical protein QWY16_06215 [Planococcus shenhongbingii]|uniref:hypothetical protein n=1 Tax=Planococcus shenhongbingii TaxID=3058398 RepID=UPI002615789B|nr:hypothetical protein [Planococcus sp. N016]WKA59719.1 hypothetical protein QWY16_06215 [Planococcus sp. N016]
MSQYAAAIDAKKQRSACGPTTIAAILKHHEKIDYGIEQLYGLLGTTPIGLFTWRLIKNFKKAAGQRYHIEKVRSLETVKSELLAGRPLAMKFDRYFSFRWFSKPLYDYHWVPLIGFEDEDDDVVLYIHDNGKRNRPSKIRAVSYNENRNVLTFVRICPVKRR